MSDISAYGRLVEGRYLVRSHHFTMARSRSYGRRL